MRTAIVNGMCKRWTVVLINCDLKDRNLVENVDITLRLSDAKSIRPYLGFLAQTPV